MMHVDLGKCTGCGECLTVCPVDAISLVHGKAAIDSEACLACYACADACPQGAISEARLPATVKTTAIRPAERQPVVPVTTYQPGSRLAWVRPVLSFLGREVVPVVADALIAAADRRSSTIIDDKQATVTNLQPGRPAAGGRRQVRRRRRGRQA